MIHHFAAIDTTALVEYLKDCTDWGIKAGMQATGFISGMALLIHLFKH